MDFKIAASVSKKSIEDIKQIIIDTIKFKKDVLLSRNKYMKFFSSLLDTINKDFLNDQTLSSIDGSTLFSSFLDKIGMERSDYIEKYIKKIISENKLNTIFPEKLTKAIQSID